MDVKRGILILVVLLVLSSAGVVAFEKYQMVYWNVDCDPDEICETPEIIFYQRGLGGSWPCTATDSGELPRSWPPDSEGCYFGARNKEGAGDTCGWSISSTGYNINNENKRITPLNNNIGQTYCPDEDPDGQWFCSDDGGEQAEVALRTNVQYKDGKGLICGNDNYWYQCDDTVLGQTITIGVEEFICLGTASGTYLWTTEVSEIFDSDGDGVPDLNDCAPRDSSVFSNFPFGCSTAEGSPLPCLNQLLASEKCGDNVDNDCSEWRGEPEYVYDDVIDDCDLPEFETSCEINNDWLLSSTGNNCCGDDPSDLGVIASGTKSGSSGNYLCVNSEEAGYDKEGGRATQPASSLFADGGACAGEEWCWLDASVGAFKIFTINKAYDVVSNGAQWYACNLATNEGPLNQTPSSVSPSGEETYDDLRKTSNRFFCYDEGNHWSWAECVKEVTAAENGGAKVREKGQGLFTLFTPPVQSAGSSARILASDLAYVSYYGDGALLDFTGYQYLNFLVDFQEELGDEALPLSLFVDISGPDDTSYFKKNVLGDIISRPLFPEGEQFMHVKVPIAPFSNVASILISNDQEISMRVKDVYLSSDAQEFLCSGQESATENVWIENIDDGGGRITGAAICTSRYGDSAWLGDDTVVEEAAANCCGNDFNDGNGEYYAGASREYTDGQNYACWNSQAVAEGMPITNVEFAVRYKSLVEKRELDLSFESGIRITVIEGSEVTEQRTYACSFSECLLPLLHGTTFVTNKHPGLYDLYLITKNPETEEIQQILVGSEGLSVTMPAMLKAKNVPQQVVFISDEQDIGFYGCQAPQYIKDTGELAEDLDFCSPKAEQFCAPSSLAVGGVPSWSTEALEQIGYAEPTSIPTSVSELALKEDATEEEKAALSRTHQTSILPGRNFLPNAAFAFEGNTVPGWTLFSSRPLREVFSNEKAELRSGEVLRSGRLAVPSGITLDFSQHAFANQCPAQFFLYDKDGKERPLTEKRFSTGTDSFVVVEFSGPEVGKLSCTIENPLLQIIDDLGPATYDAEDAQRNIPLSLHRQGQSCCAEDSCWNGFTCVASMDDSPLLAEPVGEDRYYRCIAGEWTYQPVKQSLNGQPGFCSAQSQCFVSAEGSSAVTAPQLFAEGYGSELPSCINDNEFLFDNYCQEGNWTSRTRAVAGRLFEIADGKDYVLYCTDYQTALIDAEFSKATLGGTFGNPLSGEQTCFENLNSLIPDDENKCINNVCILQYKEGNQWKTAFATTINKPLPDEDSVFSALGIDSESCVGSSSGFAKCTVGGADVWYAQDLQAIAYAREEIDLSGGRGFSFDALLGRLDENARDFLSSVKNFRDLYLLNKECQGVFGFLQPDCRKVRAVKERGFNEDKEVTKTLKAEYEGFDTPICEYVDKKRLAYPDFQRPLPLPSREEPLRCFVDGDVQKVKAITGADFLWPQLTGKLRVSDE